MDLYIRASEIKNNHNLILVIIYNFTPSCKKIGKSHFIDQPYDKTLKSMS